MPENIGCSTRILIIVSIFFLVLLGIGLAFGPLGASLFGTEAPGFLKIPVPHVELPSEGIFDIASFTVTNTLIASWLTIIMLGILSFVFTRKMKLIPGRLQSIGELIVEIVLNFVEGAAGKKHARILFPVVATIFIYVVTNAYMALLPFYGTIGIDEGEGAVVPLLRAANTDINLPLSIALISFIFVEYLGLRSLGIFRYLHTFFDLSQLREGFTNLLKGKIRPAISGIMFGFINLFIGCLEVLSHFIRIISFTFRLFGNMTAGEILLLIISFLVPLIAIIPFYGLELLVGFLQAMIFAGLTLVFGTIALAPHGEEQEQTT